MFNREPDSKVVPYMFEGREVEKTPAFGLKTLFVEDLLNSDFKSTIKAIYDCYNKNDYEHIFFGANNSLTPDTSHDVFFRDWDPIIEHFLDQGYLCSLDVPPELIHKVFNLSLLTNFNNFIPQIRIPVPYDHLNYNTHLKIEPYKTSKTKKETPGVWTHSLNSLTQEDAFTSWRDYKDDKRLN